MPREQVMCNQKTVLELLRRLGPSDITSIRFMLSPGEGTVYPPSAVLRVLRTLERKDLVVIADTDWPLPSLKNRKWRLSRKAREREER